MSHPVALVTGASSGIGEALAGCFAQGGHALALVARSAAKLRQLANTLAAAHGVKVWVAPADLSLPGAAAGLAATIKRAKRPIDVLVNHAGVLEHGSFVEMPAERPRQMIDLNVSGLTAMLAQFVPAMLARGHGRVLNAASIAAFQPIPSLAESLSEELKDTGVSVTALCPGITATPLLSAAKQSSAQLDKLPGFLVGDVDVVAREGHAACLSGEVIRAPGVLNLATILVSRATPKWLLRRVSGALPRRMK